MMENKTDRKVIKGHLRQIFLRSRERAACFKRDGYRCRKCGIKQCKAKGSKVSIQCDHIKGIDIWDEVIQLIRDKILCDGHPEDLQTLCTHCHKGKTLMEKHQINSKKNK